MARFRHMVTLGGSITTGYASSDHGTRSWAALVAAALTAEGRGSFRWTNRGVSGTDSVCGAARLADHLTVATDPLPDLVIVEQAVNDQWLDPQVSPASYEGLLRQLLVRVPRPTVLCLLLGEKGGTVSAASRVQQMLAEYYGLSWVRPDLELVPGAFGPEDPVHPIDAGHALIAQAVLQAVGRGLPQGVDPLPPPLFSSDWQHVRVWSATDTVPVAAAGWQSGGDVHEEWKRHGGAPQGWTTTADDAELVLEVTGSVIGVLISESEHYRNAEAWLEGGSPRVLTGYRPDRRGYLGWSWHALCRQAVTGVQRLHVRPARDRWQGSGRPVHVVAVMAAGVPQGGAASGGPVRERPPAELPLRTVGRFALGALPALTLGWSLTTVSGTFSGDRLHLTFRDTRDRVLVRLTVDGASQTYRLPEGSGTLSATGLGPGRGQGQHEFELVKLSEGLFGSTTLTGLDVGPSGSWLPAPTRPRRRIEVYGDSITAGACNLDIGADQYDDLATHDPTLSYVALAARRWDADVVAIAVSGSGLTASWNPVLLPEVADRWWPDSGAEVAPSDRDPDVVLINVGTNDLGFPQSQGDDLSPDYAQALVAFVRSRRVRYPGAWLVGALGGIYPPEEAQNLRQAWRRAWTTLAASDPRVRSFEFQTSSPAHPRVDAHVRMADELLAFLTKEISL